MPPSFFFFNAALVGGEEMPAIPGMAPAVLRLAVFTDVTAGRAENASQPDCLLIVYQCTVHTGTIQPDCLLKVYQCINVPYTLQQVNLTACS